MKTKDIQLNAEYEVNGNSRYSHGHARVTVLEIGAEREVRGSGYYPRHVNDGIRVRVEEVLDGSVHVAHGALYSGHRPDRHVGFGATFTGEETVIRPQEVVQPWSKYLTVRAEREARQKEAHERFDRHAAEAMDSAKVQVQRLLDQGLRHGTDSYNDHKDFYIEHPNEPGADVKITQRGAWKLLEELEQR